VRIEPYYRGFAGTITRVSTSGPSKYLIRGVHGVYPEKKQVRVTELPIGFWTDDFKKYLETLIEAGTIKEYADMSTDTVVDFTITFPASTDLNDAAFSSVVEYGCCTGLEKLLKLYSTETTSNMHLFDSRDQLRKYSSVEEIANDYYATRLALYEKRKAHQLACLSSELGVLSNKARYIQEVLDGSIDLRRKRGDEVVSMLKEKGYQGQGQCQGDEGNEGNEEKDQYKYLLKLPMDSVSDENVDRLVKERDHKKSQYETLNKTSPENLWLSDLDELRAEYLKQEEKRFKSIALSSTPSSSGAGAHTKVKKCVVKKTSVE
jgi:DNA topoisomerase-2